MPARSQRRVTAAERIHAVTVQVPGPVTPDGDGAYEELWTDLADLDAAIRPALGRDLERVASTVGAVATHVVTVPYVPGVTAQARVLFGARVLAVLGLQDPDERHIELVLLCAEAAQGDTVSAMELLLAEFGGEPFSFVLPTAPDAYPSGATFDKLVPGSYTATLNRTRLVGGTYVLEASAKVDGPGGRAKLALVDLADPDVPVVEIAFTADQTAGETRRSAAFAIPFADTTYGIKGTTDDVSVAAALWGAHILRT